MSIHTETNHHEQGSEGDKELHPGGTQLEVVVKKGGDGLRHGKEVGVGMDG
uniref:Uncharacterized protein n=1 Tax=Arundo donax TaxID=35708 RepID=A0A0A8YW43_ARUDO